MADGNVTRRIRGRFMRLLSAEQAEALCEAAGSGLREYRVAVLELGYVRMEAMLLPDRDGWRGCYDVYVKDKPEAKEWVFYCSPDGDVDVLHGHLQSRMLCRLLRFLNDAGLTFSECRFPTKPGIGKPGAEGR